MPLNRSPQVLQPTPRAAADARRWVQQVCLDLGREDLLEAAALGASELATNAVLHSAPPFAVAVRGTRAHPRVEVRDSSPVLPPQARLSRNDDFLTTFGRGLAIVSMSATAWGGTVDERGKVMWFEPAPTTRDDPTPGVLEPGPEATSWQRPADAVDVRLLGIDVALHLRVGLQYEEIRRELRLLAVAHESDYPLAANLSEVFNGFERLFNRDPSENPVKSAPADQPAIDATVPVSPTWAPLVSTMIEMTELADQFCRSERLLSLQRTPVQRTYQEWLLTEFLRQIDGEEPIPWPHAASLTRSAHTS